MAAPSLGLRSRRREPTGSHVPILQVGLLSLGGDGEELPGEMKPQHHVAWAHTGPSHKCKLLAGTRQDQAPTNVYT